MTIKNIHKKGWSADFLSYTGLVIGLTLVLFVAYTLLEPFFTSKELEDTIIDLQLSEDDVFLIMLLRQTTNQRPLSQSIIEQYSTNNNYAFQIEKEVRTFYPKNSIYISINNQHTGILTTKPHKIIDSTVVLPLPMGMQKETIEMRVVVE